MASMSCPRCSHGFETLARSARTRCPSCRSAVTVPAAVRRANGWEGTTPAKARSTEHTLVLVQLECGHPDVVVVHPGKSIATEVRSTEWECEGVTVRASREIARFSGSEWNKLSTEQVVALVKAAGCLA